MKDPIAVIKIYEGENEEDFAWKTVATTKETGVVFQGNSDSLHSAILQVTDGLDRVFKNRGDKK